MALEDILKVLAENSTQDGGQTQIGGNPLIGMLGSLLGGDSMGSGTQGLGGQGMGSDPLSALLGGMGGGQASPLQALIQPIVTAISEKLGIPPQIAVVVVTLVLNYLISKHGSQITSGKSLSGLMDQHADQDFIQSTGLTKQLVQQTGMDPEMAAKSLSTVFSMMGAQTGGGGKSSSGRATASIKSQVAPSKSKAATKSKSAPVKAKKSVAKPKKK